MGRHRENPAGRHSIRTNQCPPPSSPPFNQHCTIEKHKPRLYGDKVLRTNAHPVSHLSVKTTSRTLQSISLAQPTWHSCRQYTAMFSICPTNLLFQNQYTLGQVHQREPVTITGTCITKAACSFCCPTNSVKALKVTKSSDANQLKLTTSSILHLPTNSWLSNTTAHKLRNTTNSQVKIQFNPQKIATKGFSIDSVRF